LVGYLVNLEVKVADGTEAAPGGAPAVTAQSAAAAAAGAGAALSAAPAAPRLVAKGIDGPERRAPLQYSAPSIDGDAGAGAASSIQDDAPDGDGGTTNREARRNAAKRRKG
jgi:preprotein translocase subunit SecA